MIRSQVLPKNEILRQTLFANFGTLSVDRKQRFRLKPKFHRKCQFRPNPKPKFWSTTRLSRFKFQAFILTLQESEDVRERLMSMEAELRALRDELSNRSSLASNTSSQATVKDKEESTTQPARPPSGTESETKKAQECCPEQIDKNDPLSPPPQAKKAKITEDDKESDEKQKPDENKT